MRMVLSRTRICDRSEPSRFAATVPASCHEWQVAPKSDRTWARRRSRRVVSTRRAPLPWMAIAGLFLRSMEAQQKKCGPAPYTMDGYLRELQ